MLLDGGREVLGSVSVGHSPIALSCVPSLVFPQSPCAFLHVRLSSSRPAAKTCWWRGLRLGIILSLSTVLQMSSLRLRGGGSEQKASIGSNSGSHGSVWNASLESSAGNVWAEGCARQQPRFSCALPDAVSRSRSHSQDFYWYKSHDAASESQFHSQCCRIEWSSGGKSCHEDADVMDERGRGDEECRGTYMKKDRDVEAQSCNDIGVMNEGCRVDQGCKGKNVMIHKERGDRDGEDVNMVDEGKGVLVAMLDRTCGSKSCCKDVVILDDSDDHFPHTVTDRRCCVDMVNENGEALAQEWARSSSSSYGNLAMNLGGIEFSHQATGNLRFGDKSSSSSGPLSAGAEEYFPVSDDACTVTDCAEHRRASTSPSSSVSGGFFRSSDESYRASIRTESRRSSTDSSSSVPVEDTQSYAEKGVLAAETNCFDLPKGASVHRSYGSWNIDSVHDHPEVQQGGRDEEEEVQWGEAGGRKGSARGRRRKRAENSSRRGRGLGICASIGCVKQPFYGWSAGEPA